MRPKHAIHARGSASELRIVFTASPSAMAIRAIEPLNAPLCSALVISMITVSPSSSIASSRSMTPTTLLVTPGANKTFTSPLARKSAPSVAVPRFVVRTRTTLNLFDAFDSVMLKRRRPSPSLAAVSAIETVSGGSLGLSVSVTSSSSLRPAVNVHIIENRALLPLSSNWESPAVFGVRDVLGKANGFSAGRAARDREQSRKTTPILGKRKKRAIFYNPCMASSGAHAHRGPGELARLVLSLAGAPESRD